MTQTSLDRYICGLQLGIIYFEGSFSEGNDKRAVYEYEDTYPIYLRYTIGRRKTKIIMLSISKKSSEPMGQARMLNPEPLSLFIVLEGSNGIQIDVTQDLRQIHDVIAASFSTGTTLLVDMGKGTTRHLNPRYIKEIRVERRQENWT